MVEYGYEGTNPHDKLQDSVTFGNTDMERLHRTIKDRIAVEKERRLAKDGGANFIPYEIDDLVLAKNMTLNGLLK